MISLWNVLKQEREEILYCPHRFGRISYDSLKSMVEEGHHADYTIEEAVRYNKRYRDCLRKRGMDALIRQLRDELGDMADTPRLFDYLRREFERTGIAPYDVLCLPTNAPIKLLGHTFKGWEELFACRAQSTSITYVRKDKELDLYSRTPKKSVKGIYVTELYASYPCFDSSDYANENRFYTNLFLTRKPAPKELVKRLALLHSNGNYDLCTEHIPEELLPIVHYPGEGEYLIVARR